MARWIPCGTEFIEADVIRWVEPIWKPRARRSRRAVKIGERRITAQVLKVTADGWVHLLVKRCEMTPVPDWWKALPPLRQEGGELRRRRQSIGRGQAERLLWSEEGARSSVASRFLKPE